MKIIKQILCILLVTSMVLLSSCSFDENPSSGGSSSSEGSSAVDKSGSSEPSLAFAPIDTKDLNDYYGRFTAQDDEYIYHIQSKGVYRAPKSGGKAELLTAATSSRNLIMHGDTLYYLDDSKIYQMHKSGKDKRLLLAPQSDDKAFVELRCIGDILYVLEDTSSSFTCQYYAYNIKNNVFDLTSAERVKSVSYLYREDVPLPNGITYFTTSEGEAKSILYASDKDENRKIKVLEDVSRPLAHTWYIFSQNKIYYVDQNADYTGISIWSADFNGQNKKILYDFVLTGTESKYSYYIEDLLAYDSGWIYFRSKDFNGIKYFRVNCQTGEGSKISFLDGVSTTYGYFDVVDGWIYWNVKYDTYRIKSDGSGEIQTSPFED